MATGEAPSQAQITHLVGSLISQDPKVQASLILLPELKDQELVVYQSTGNSYWEGAVSIQGHSMEQVVKGEGYVELTGYAH